MLQPLDNSTITRLRRVPKFCFRELLERVQADYQLRLLADLA